MHHALVFIAEGVTPDANSLQFFSRFPLKRGNRIDQRHLLGFRGDIMSMVRKGLLGTTDFAFGQTQALKGLGAGDLVDQLAVNIDQGCLAGFMVDQVAFPNFIVRVLFIEDLVTKLSTEAVRDCQSIALYFLRTVGRMPPFTEIIASRPACPNGRRP